MARRLRRGSLIRYYDCEGGGFCRMDVVRYWGVRLLLGAFVSHASAQLISPTPPCAVVDKDATYRKPPLTYPMTSDRYTVQYQLGGSGTWTTAQVNISYYGGSNAPSFPGCDSFADEMSRYYTDHPRREQLGLLEGLLARSAKGNGDSVLEQEIERRTEDLRDAIEKEPYVFDRRFLLRTLAMGHSQFAEFIGARGPNTQINSACASTTQAV